MCKLIKETRKIQKTMKEVDPIGSFHDRAAINFYIKQFKKGEIKAIELINDNKKYKQQYLIN